MRCGANVLLVLLVFDAIESVLDNLALPGNSFGFGHALVVVLVQDLLFFEVCDLAGTVMR